MKNDCEKEMPVNETQTENADTLETLNYYELDSVTGGACGSDEYMTVLTAINKAYACHEVKEFIGIY